MAQKKQNTLFSKNIPIENAPTPPISKTGPAQFLHCATLVQKLFQIIPCILQFDSADFTLFALFDLIQNLLFYQVIKHILQTNSNKQNPVKTKETYNKTGHTMPITVKRTVVITKNQKLK